MITLNDADAVWGRYPALPREYIDARIATVILGLEQERDMGGRELSRAADTIERQQQEINELQDEVASLRIRQEEGSGDIAYRLVSVAIVEAAKKAMKKEPDKKILTIHVKRDYTMVINGTRYVVRVREMDV